MASWSCIVELPFFLALPTGFVVPVYLGDPEARDEHTSISLHVLNGWDGFAALRERRLITKQYAPSDQANAAIARLVTVEPGALVHRWPARTLVRSANFVAVDLRHRDTVTRDDRDNALRIFFSALNRLLLTYSFRASLEQAAQVDIVTPDTVAGISLTLKCEHQEVHFPASNWVYAQFEAPPPLGQDVLDSITSLAKEGGPTSIAFQRLVRARRAGASGDFAALVLLAWSAVEVTLRAIAQELGMTKEQIRNADRLLDRVLAELNQHNQSLEAGTGEALHEVRKLRNKVIHAGLEPDAEAARVVYRSCGNATLDLGRCARTIGLRNRRGPVLG